MMTWDEKLKTGILEIDEHHEKLFRNVGLLLEAAKDPATSSHAMREFLEFLQVYIDEHFDSEELQMLKLDYPGLFEQMREHRAFRGRYLALLSWYREKGHSTKTVLEICRFAGEWFTEHIDKLDRAFAEFVEKKNREQSSG